MFLLKKCHGKLEAVDQYIEECKALDNGNIKDFSLYLHAHWFPWLLRRPAEMLTQGKISLIRSKTSLD